MKLRSVLYFLARMMGDVSAVKKGTVVKRINRRIVGKSASRGIGKLFK